MEQVVYFVAIWSILQLFGIFYGHLLYFMVICYILWSFVIFYGHLLYFMVIWYILWSFGIHIVWSLSTFFSFLVCCIKKYLATLFQISKN
jgi:hypothetical protein